MLTTKSELIDAVEKVSNIITEFCTLGKSFYATDIFIEMYPGDDPKFYPHIFANVRRLVELAYSYGIIADGYTDATKPRSDNNDDVIYFKYC